MSTDDLRPWWDAGDWTTDPRLAFAYGIKVGLDIAADQADVDWRATYARALSAGATTDITEALRAHDRLVARRQARDEWDAAAKCVDPCPGCDKEVCRCPSLQEVPPGKWRSDRIDRSAA